jgi:hypothetical protein
MDIVTVKRPRPETAHEISVNFLSMIKARYKPKKEERRKFVAGLGIEPWTPKFRAE